MPEAGWGRWRVLWVPQYQAGEVGHSEQVKQRESEFKCPVVCWTQTLCLFIGGYFSNHPEAETMGWVGHRDMSLRHRNSQKHRLHLDKITGCHYQPMELTGSKNTRNLSFHGSNTATCSAQMMPAYGCSTPRQTTLQSQTHTKQDPRGGALPVPIHPGTAAEDKDKGGSSHWTQRSRAGSCRTGWPAQQLITPVPPATIHPELPYFLPLQTGGLL